MIPIVPLFESKIITRENLNKNNMLKVLNMYEHSNGILTMKNIRMV